MILGEGRERKRERRERSAEIWRSGPFLFLLTNLSKLAPTLERRGLCSSIAWVQNLPIPVLAARWSAKVRA